MLRFHNADRRRSWSGMIAVFLAVVLTNAGGVRGQAADEALARQVFEVAENWVRRAEVPESTLPIRADNVAAVHVTLRRNGLTFGRATTTAEEADADANSDAQEQEEDEREETAGETDLMRMLRPAVTEALRQSAGKLDQPGELREIAPELSLDLQLAHPPELIDMEHLRELPSRLTVNLHGLAMRRGSRWAWMFPGDATAANTTLSGQLNRLLADLDLPLDQMERVGRPDGPPLYRFEVIHLVRPRPDQSVERLHRGNVLMPAVSLDDQSLRVLGRQLADHLLGQQRSDGRFAGTYEPTADRHQPPTAGPFDAAHAVLALARVARLPNLEDERRDRAAEAARRGVEALARAVLDADAGEDDRSDPAARLGPAAMTLLAMLETPAAGDHEEARDRLISALEAMRQPDGLFHAGTRSNARPAPRPHQSLAAAAIVQLYERTRDPDWLEQSRQTLDALWDEMEGEDFVESLPWLVYAETTLIRLGHPTSHQEQLAEQSSELWKQQVTPWTDERDGLPRSPDTIGGFLIGHPLIDDPTSQSAPLLAAQAIVLRTEGLVDESDRPRWLFRCGLAGRFLAQLTMQPPSAYYARSPSEAVGGMRMSFWNNRQPIDVTASGLLAVTELQHTLARLAELQ